MSENTAPAGCTELEWKAARRAGLLFADLGSTAQERAIHAFADSIRSRWVPVGEHLPPDETPVLICISGQVRIGERRWDVPGYKDSYQKFWYWDDPINDGQCWEVPDVTHWMPLPGAPA